MGLGERAPEFEIATIDWWRAVGRRGGRYARLDFIEKPTLVPPTTLIDVSAPRDMHLYAQPEKYLTKKRLKRAVRTDVAAI